MTLHSPRCDAAWNSLSIATIEMPLFYFDLCVDGQAVVDPQGLRLAALGEAKFQAAVALAEMMVEAVMEERGRSLDITISDEDRKPLARVFISIREDLS
jgi:hypothetical protein